MSIKNPDGTIHSDGVTYHPSYDAARTYAKANDLPTDRIISYGLGWAIQYRVSGPYDGPNLSERVAAMNDGHWPIPW